MDRTNVVWWAAAAAVAVSVGCKGGGDGDDDDDEGVPPPLVLSTVAGEARDVDLELVDSSCDNDVLDDIDDLELKLSQVSTGLSVFVDDDLGWIPCDGWVEDFDCRWGEAANNDGSWSWRLWGTAAGAELDALLSLTVTCEAGDDECEACEAVAQVTGSLSN
jgi:hypothetical protein